MARKKQVKDLKIVLLDPSTLRLAPWNPAEHTERGLNAVDESIKEFGWMEPVVVWRGYVINGNARLKRTLARAETTIPAVVRNDLTEAQAKAYTLVSRRIPQLMIDDEQKVFDLAAAMPSEKLTPFYTQDELDEKRNYLEALLRARSGDSRSDLAQDVDTRRKPEMMELRLTVPMDIWLRVGDVFEDWFKERTEDNAGITYTKRKKGG